MDMFGIDLGELLGVVAFGVLFFDRLSKYTKNKTDDKIMEWVYKIATILGVRVPEVKDK